MRDVIKACGNKDWRKRWTANLALQLVNGSLNPNVLLNAKDDYKARLHERQRLWAELQPVSPPEPMLL